MRTRRILTTLFLGSLGACTAGDSKDEDTDPTGITDTDDTPTAVETDTVRPTDEETDDSDLPGLRDIAIEDLTITEVMANPGACTDDEGEYFEVLYSGDVTVSIAGLVIADEVANYTVPLPGVITPGQRLIFARNGNGLMSCYRVAADFQTGLGLNNAGDQISISDGNSKLFDTLDLDQFRSGAEIASGIAYERDDADSNVWCAANTPIGTTDDVGSPGQANGSCDDTNDTDDTDDTTDTDTIPGVQTIAPGDLRITEFLPQVANASTCTDVSGEYVEVLYTGPNQVDLNGLIVSNLTTNTPLQQSLIVDPGDRLVFARNAAGFTSCYGFAPDAETRFTMNDNGDVLTLANGAGTTLDEVDYIGWVVNPGAAWEQDDVDLNAWCPATDAIGSTGNLGTPGAANGVCEADTDDTDDTDTLTLDDLSEGAFTIEEMMVNPAACGDPDGEFIEILYHGTVPVSLDGLVVSDLSNQSFVFTSIIAQPGERYVIFNDASPGGCYGLIGIPYGGVSLNNGTGDRISIASPTGIVFDTVDYRGWTILPGQTLQKDDNDVWCSSTSPIPGSADFGTPGAPNPECVFDTDTGPEETDDSSIDSDDTDYGFGRTARNLVPGELIITEFMADVGNGLCLDIDGEYIELLYTGTDPVDLFGLVMEDATDSVRFTGHLIAEQGDRIMLARTPSELVNCYGLPGDIESGITLNNNGDLFRIRAGGRTLDEVDFRTWTVTNGVAWELDDVDLTTWCEADVEAPGTFNLGSPGLPNGTCSADTDTDVTPDPCLVDLEFAGTIVTTFDTPFGFSGSTLRTTGIEGSLTYNTCLPDADSRVNFGTYQHTGDGVFEVELLATGTTITGSGFPTLDIDDFASDTWRFSDGPAPLIPNRFLRVDNALAPDTTLVIAITDNTGSAITTDAAPNPFPMENIGAYSHTFAISDPNTGTINIQLDRIGPPGSFDTDETDDTDPVIETDDTDPVIETDDTDPVIETDDTDETDPVDTDGVVAIDDVAAGDLRITEFMAQPLNCNANGGEFIEILNTSNRTIQLSGMKVGHQVFATSLVASAELAPGERTIVTGSTGTFLTCYNTPANAQYLGTINNTGDVLTVQDSTDRVIDQVDFTSWGVTAGTSWSLADDDLTTWCLSSTPSASGELATPGDPNGDCVVDTDIPALTLAEIAPGDLTVTEVMLDPTDATCPDAQGEYIEVRYTGPGELDLTGLVITTLAGPQTAGVAGVIVAPDTRFLLARDIAGLNACFGVTAIGTFSNALADTGDVVLLTSGATVFDQFSSTGEPHTEGVAKERDDDVGDVCDADTLIPGTTTEFGTPGTANGACPIPDTDIEETDTDETDVVPMNADALQPGDLYISEFMVAPTACPDPDGEYLELTYTGSTAGNLEGLVIKVGFASVTVAGSTPISAGDTILLARDVSGLTACYGVTGRFTYALELPDTGQTIEIANSTQTLDSVDYSVWNLRPGVAVQRDPTDATLYCRAEDAINGTADLGTPGDPNGACLTDIETDEPFETDEDTDPVIVPFDLFITEVADYPANRNLRYVEVYNPGPGDANLSGWQILQYSNGSTTPTATNLSNVTIPPGEEWVVGRDVTFGVYTAAFGSEPNQKATTISGNGNDAYVLAYQGVPVDAYGVPGVDGFGQPWEYTAQIATRLITVTQSSTTWVQAEWSLSSNPNTATFGYFGDPDTDSVIDTDPIETDVEETDDTFPDLPGPGDITPGQIVITEFMADPAACADLAGEYIEVQNRSGITLNLQGLRVVTFNGVHTVDRFTRIEDGAYAVLARNGAAYAGCYGTDPDADIGVELSNAPGIITLEAPNLVPLDSYGYFGLTPPTGASWERDASDDDVWCEADTPSTSGDLGSPGASNGDCVFPDTDPTDPTDETDIGPTDDTDDTDETDTTPPALTLADLAPTDLVVTELMVEPAACAATIGQYVEVHYRGTEAVDLQGLNVLTNGNSTTVAGSVIVAPDTYVIFARNPGQIGTCYPSITTSIPLGLPVNANGDTIRINGGGQTFVGYDENSDEFTELGASRQLSSDEAGYCYSDAEIGTTGDFGTPGAENTLCVFDTYMGPDADLTIADLTPTTLRITEHLVDPVGCPDSQAEYVELHYTGAQTIDLQGLILSDRRDDFVMPRPRFVQPDTRIVVARNAAGFQACYGFAADVEVPIPQPNSGGAVQALGSGNNLLSEADFFGLQFSPGRARLRSDVDPNEWCDAITPIGTSANFGTPGLPNGDCVIPDTDPTDIPDTDPTDVPETDETDPPVLTLDDLNPSNLHITEYMADPTGCPDGDAEFVEILYSGPAAADLDGLILRASNGGEWTFPPASIVQPGQYVVAGANASNFSACYGVPLDFEFSITLDDVLERPTLVRSNGFTFDPPFGGAYMPVSGRAWQRTQDGSDVWCPSETLVPSGDYATPGAENDVCVFDTDVVVETDETDETDRPTLTMDQVTPGLILISEIMADPAACPDADCEYVELFVVGSSNIDIQGLRLSDGTTTVVVNNSVIVAPFEPLLIAPNPGGISANYGVQAGPAPGLSINEAAGSISVSNASMVLTQYSWTTPLPNGASWQQDGTGAGTFCASTVDINGTGDRGTPGAQNLPCP